MTPNLPAMAADLVQRKRALIFADALPVALAAKAATTIPIVFVSGPDPVHFASFASCFFSVHDIANHPCDSKMPAKARAVASLVPSSTISTARRRRNAPRDSPSALWPWALWPWALWVSPVGSGWSKDHSGPAIRPSRSSTRRTSSNAAEIFPLGKCICPKP
jgi:hypothetical protein